MRRLRTLALIVVGSCAFAGIGYAAAWTMAPPRDAGGPPPPDAPITAPVEERRLSLTAVLRGDAGFSDPVAPEIAVTAEVPVVTRTPARPGQEVDAGDLVLEVAGRPVIALPGILPPYRDLRAGDTGPDVLQLEQALVEVGLDPGEVDEDFTSTTAAAVTALYDWLGYDVPTAGDLAPAAPGPGSPSGQGPGAGTDPGEDAVVLPRGEVTFVASLPRQIDRLTARVGKLVPKDPVMLSGAELLVSVGLTAADLDVLEAGMEAVVDLPGGEPVTGRLGPVRATEGGGRTTVLLPELGERRERAVRDANVKVTVPLQSSRGRVLVVPLAALTTDAAAVVRVAKVVGDSTQTVEVEVGLSADGYAEVTPVDGGLAADDRVVVGE